MQRGVRYNLPFMQLLRPKTTYSQMAKIFLDRVRKVGQNWKVMDEKNRHQKRIRQSTHNWFEILPFFTFLSTCTRDLMGSPVLAKWIHLKWVPIIFSLLSIDNRCHSRWQSGMCISSFFWKIQVFFFLIPYKNPKFICSRLVVFANSKCNQ